jgi:hypothetical protein
MENENEYLEMCDHFKKVVEDKDKCIKMLCVVNHEIKKEILTAYGMIRLIDREIGAIEGVPCNIKHLVEDLRGHLSEFYDNLFPFTNNNGQDI